MSTGSEWGRILADPTLNRLVHRLNKKYLWMSEADLEHIVLVFEKAGKIHLFKISEYKKDNHE